MRASAAASVALLILVLVCPSGCARSRTFTIYAKPADAKLVINGVERGPGPITQRFEFGSSSSAARVVALREGYETKTQRLNANTPRDTVVIELQAIGPKAILSVEPAAMIRVNGVLVRPTPVRQYELTLDPNTPGKTYTVVAEQTGYARETRTINAKDPQGYYRIVLRSLNAPDGAIAEASRPRDRIAPTQPARRQQASAQPDRGPPVLPRTRRSVPDTVIVQPPVARAEPASLRRDIVIRTDPPAAGAKIYIGEENWGDREVQLTGHEFARDAAGKPAPQQVRATAPGFEGGQVTMRWEDDRSLYLVPLGRRRKEVRIATDPSNAVVMLNGKTLEKDGEGVATDTLFFPPQDPPEKPTTYVATVSVPDAPGGVPGAFEPAQIRIGWDDGRKDYAAALNPSRFVKVPLVRAAPTWDERGGWRATATRTEALAARDPGEGAGRPTPQPLTELPAGTMLDSVVASPDGSLVLYTELIPGQGAAPLKSQMRVLTSDGAPGAMLPSDGRHFDAMPSFTPDGAEIVFTSDRAGVGLDVWSMKVAPDGAVRQLARGGEKAALWPMIDASPSPRLFYEEYLKPAARPTDARSEIHMVALQAKPPTNQRLSPGARPRASPRADAVVFTLADPVTGKRDLYLISDREGAGFGGPPINLTNTPDVDDCDPAWSRTGGKIAYASDAGSDDTGRRNYDLYVLTLSDPQHPVRVTYNGSCDDSPALDPAGKNVYFRSNRGGRWGIWKARVP